MPRKFKTMFCIHPVWALDWHMWSMIRKYLPNKQAAEQIQSMETGSWVEQHGVSISWQNLLNALQKSIDLYSKSQDAEGDIVWQKEVGGAQRLLPAHVIDEYCHPARPFDKRSNPFERPIEPYPDFTSTLTLPRRHRLKEEWFTASYNGGKLGDTFAMGRSSFSTADKIVSCRRVILRYGNGGMGWMMGPQMEREGYVPAHDLKACCSLLNTRMQQRDELIAELTQKARAQFGTRNLPF